MHVYEHVPFSHEFVAFSTLHFLPCSPQFSVLSSSHISPYLLYLSLHVKLQTPPVHVFVAFAAVNSAVVGAVGLALIQVDVMIRIACV